MPPLLPLLNRERKTEIQLEIFTSDVFVVGTKAITLDGELINMDGRGDRVAAMIVGPKKMLVVTGVNKIVSGKNSHYRLCTLHPGYEDCCSLN